MVLISEIMEDAKKEGEPKEADGEQEDEEKAEDGLQEERDETEERSQEPAAVDRAELAAPPAEDPKKEASPPSGKMLYNDYFLRVAYIMQSYLYMRQGGAAASRGASSGGGGPAGEERCRAMMEVVRKESGRWAVPRLMLEHTHPLEPPPDPADIAAVSPSCLPFASRQHPLWPPRRSQPRPPRRHHRPPQPQVLLRPRPPPPNLHACFYHDFCKHYLWPLLHYLLPLSPRPSVAYISMETQGDATSTKP